VHTLITYTVAFLFLSGFTTLLTFTTYRQVREYKAAHKKRTQQEALTLYLHPATRAKVEEDRAYQLAQERIAIERGKLQLSYLQLFLKSDHIAESSTQAYTTSEQPRLERIIATLAPNALELVYGLDPITGELVKTTLLQAIHMQLLGTSGQGKSKQATSILAQLASRNDEAHLQLALIDCEGETTAPFQNLPHVRYLADEPEAAARTLKSIENELEQRDRTKTIYPVLLVFVEEFLQLFRIMPTKYKDAALEHYTSLALRGRKRGMFLFSIGQTAYTQKAIRDAQAQFLSSMAFAVKPSAARAAGFTNTSLLNQLYHEKRPGQFLLERPAGDSILLAPYVESSIVTHLLAKRETEPLSTITREQQARTNREQNQLDAALEAKLAQVMQLHTTGKGKGEIIQAIWGVTPGTSRAYKEATEEYIQVMQTLMSRAEARVSQTEGS
jgi:hypothetical protein